MTIWAILPAAGIGRRMGSNTPKQYLPLPELTAGVDAVADAKPVIRHTLERLLAVSAITKVVVVLHPQDEHWHLLGMERENDSRVSTCIGGDERYQSVLNGLNHIFTEAKSEDWVLVHDAVRPCVRVEDIQKLIDSLDKHDVGGLIGSSIDNTLKQIDSGDNIVATIARSSYRNALTPQMFRFEMLRNAIEDLISNSETVTDESAAMERMGHTPLMVMGNKDNIKITHESDLILAAAILQSQESSRAEQSANERPSANEKPSANKEPGNE